MEQKRAVNQILPAWAELVQVVKAAVKEELSSPALAALVSTTITMLMYATASGSSNKMIVLLTIALAVILGIGWGRFLTNRFGLSRIEFDCVKGPNPKQKEIVEEFVAEWPSR